MDRNCQAYVLDRLRQLRALSDEAVSLASTGRETALRGCLRDAAHQLELARLGCEREGGYGGSLL